VFLLAEGAINWGSKLLPSVATSTLEAEYMAGAWGVKEAPWLRKLTTPLRGAEGAEGNYQANQGAFALQHNPESHQRAKHIDVAYHLRESAALGEIECRDRVLSNRGHAGRPLHQGACKAQA
jgi:hypothetical protein